MFRLLVLIIPLSIHANTLRVSAQETLPSKVPDLINTLQQREWISLSAEGEIDGVVNALEGKGELRIQPNVTVALVRDGKVVVQTVTAADGKFQFRNVKPDTYALVAKSDSTFAAVALHVLPTDEKLPSSIDIYSTKLTESKARELIHNHWVPSQADLPYYRDHQRDPLASKRIFNDSHLIRLQGESLVGRVSRPGWLFAEQDLSGTIVKVFNEGRVVGEAAVQPDGFFNFKKLKPGGYDLLVVGNDGVAVIGFEAIAEDAKVLKTESGKSVLVSAQSQVSDTLCCEMVQPIDVSPVVMDQACMACDPSIPTVGDPLIGEPIIGEPIFGAPGMGGFGGGGMGGGMGGGGGFGGGAGGGVGGGVGGLGGLLGIAGLAAGVAALANDDGFNANVATPIN